ncbi:LacI family DNA-binding transcriptional regulator [Paenibacillus hunanensis]|uniref:DNA-binding LacI/PurR family transcriptional regulator n=1 Tax=Paenibacillus hunanensis TaxID=539262 RepID=A0ABU1J095_9BACL|nr:LacI family DNA-binding transcriptional regulator [Paenibacillus hunanensis]MCL9661596.1 LacI family transcriptional regulator [Paenibacillus hunanensis]MDR6244903.1 DNA-binding LacI/PurR family transcriptional regulator [Paenibacillus hunanensis]GGJ05015.1 LacI family transcriptional regulator [Paenibacillus hunanensis]
MKTSIFDVAKRSGLSVVTVSRVLNGAQTVREKNRLKVLEAIRELDYRPSAAARSLARGRTGTIGLIVTTLQDSFFDSVAKEINDLLAAEGYYLAISVSRGLDHSGQHYMIQEDRLDGLILLSPVEEEDFVRELRARHIPYVLIDNQQPAHNEEAVQIDNYRGGYVAGRHLLEQGHQRIAHLCGEELYRSTVERRRGFVQALQEEGLEPIMIEQGEYSIGFGYATARRWLEADTLPEAIFAGDDYIALGFINALLEAGLSVPRDISVIGYDDQVIAAKLHPLLTTIRQPADEIARAAVQQMLRKINEPDQPVPGVCICPELIIRQSTAVR